MSHPLKSLLSLLFGFLSIALLSILTDSLLENFGIFPSQSNPELFATWMLVFALFYRSLYTVLGGYITAKFAPKYPERHIIVLMILGVIGGTTGVIVGWNLGAHWYPIALAVTGPIFVWIGGKIQMKS